MMTVAQLGSLLLAGQATNGAPPPVRREVDARGPAGADAGQQRVRGRDAWLVRTFEG